MIALPFGLLGLWLALRTEATPGPAPQDDPAAVPAGSGATTPAASTGDTPEATPTSPDPPREREPAPAPEEPWLAAAIALFERARQDPELTVVRARIERIGNSTKARYPTAEVRLRITQADPRRELRRGSIVTAAISPAYAEEQFGATTPIEALAEGDTRDVVLALRAPAVLRGLRRDRWIVVCGPRLPEELPPPTVPEPIRRFTATPDTWVVQGRLRAVHGSPFQTLRIAVIAVASGEDTVVAGTDVEVLDLIRTLEPTPRRQLDASDLGVTRWFVFARVGGRHVLQAWSEPIR